jgi:hypothetical protein
MEFFLRQIYPWLIEVSSYSALLPFLFGLFLFRKKKSLLFKLLLLFVAIGVMSEAAGQITYWMGTRNNLWTNHITTPLEYGVIAAVYHYSFRSPFFKKIIIGTVLALAIFSIYDAVTLEGITQMNSAPKMVANSLVIVLALSYFYKIANDRTTIYLDKDPVFLLSCGLLLYYAGTSMSFALFNHALAVSYDAARICLSVVFMLNILFNAGKVFILRRMVA